MNKSSHLLFFSLILLNSPVSQAELQPMSSAELDRLTAGSASKSTAASGGGVVGNDSSAEITSIGTVSLDSNAQEAAKALNIVNSSESTVANGLNIWNGQLEPSSLGDNLGLDTRSIEQRNDVTQDQRRVASLPSYNRPQANVEESWDNTGSSSSSATHNETNSVNNLVTTSNSMSSTNDTSVDALSTILGQQIQAGKGIAIAGLVDAFIDGGDFSINGTIGVADGAAEASITLTLNLPEITLSAEGAGCAALNGSCTAVGSTDRLDESFNDQSTSYSLETSSSGADEYTEMGSRLTRSAFEIEGALAEYIVVDNSTLNVTTDYSVNLSDSAQSGLNALNVVNAAGSAVANGVNIARSDGSTSLLLSQTNVIVHSR